MSDIKYTIEFEGDAFTLYSHVMTTFGSVPAKNFIFQGTREECEATLTKIEEIIE